MKKSFAISLAKWLVIVLMWATLMEALGRIKGVLELQLIWMKEDVEMLEAPEPPEQRYL